MPKTLKTLWIIFAVTILVPSFMIIYVIFKPPVVYPSGTIEIPVSELYRIIPDPLPDRYWILDRGHGLVLLTEVSPGFWTTARYQIGDLRDMCGPDSQGYLYCSFGGNPAGIYVFDTYTESVQRTISVDRYPRGITISPDETKLYLCVYEWPLLGVRGEYADRYMTRAHRDAGRVYEIDISTGRIQRMAVVGTLPTTIYYFDSNDNDKLLVSTTEYFPSTEHWWEDYTPTDIVDVNLFTRTARIMCTTPIREYQNDFISWPGYDNWVGLTHQGVPSFAGIQNSTDAIWLINPVTATTEDSLKIIIPRDHYTGIQRALVSICDPDILYVTQGNTFPDFKNGIFLVDRWTGQTIRGLDVQGNVPGYLWETPEGKLIATSGWFGQIFIFDNP